MQNHSGQHVLSQAFIVTAGAQTVAWRLSESTLTIDLNRVGLSEEELAEAERVGNEVVQQDHAISARIVAETELAELALRKQPDVDGPLRIVEIADFDQVACSGTHVSGTAQVGLIKVLRAERRGSGNPHPLCLRPAGHGRLWAQAPARARPGGSLHLQ